MNWERQSKLVNLLKTMCFIMLVITTFSLIYRYIGVYVDKETAEEFSYMEKVGVGVVLGKSDVSFLKSNEIAIQFKDTILYVKNVEKQIFYSLEKGDSIQVKNRKIIKK